MKKLTTALGRAKRRGITLGRAERRGITLRRAERRGITLRRAERRGITLFTMAAIAVMPLAVAPMANADVCAGASGRHVAVGGCTDVAGHVADGVAIASAVTPYVPGEVPCYTVEGVPYFTPPGDPC